MKITHRQQHNHLNINTYAQQLIKEFTPLMATSPGPSSNGSLLLIAQKVLKKMSYNAQNEKPTAPMASQRPKTPV
jgi:hypothetical protein